MFHEYFSLYKTGNTEYVGMQLAIDENYTFPVHYPTRGLLRGLGLLKQGVTIFTIT